MPTNVCRQRSNGLIASYLPFPKNPDSTHIIMATSTNNTEKQKWFPLESNPVLMNDYVDKLGFDTDAYRFVDVFATDDWALEVIPQPVAAVIMLYPLTKVQLDHETKEAAAAANQAVADASNKDGVWFIKQRIGNACGTIGLLHSLFNISATASEKVLFRPDSWLQEFHTACLGQDPLQKATILERDDTIATLHEAATSSEQNQTARGDLDEDVITHFVALVCSNNGILYELDGRKAGPVPHGPTSPATLLQDACAVIRKFMARDRDEIRFTILALAPKRED